MYVEADLAAVATLMTSHRASLLLALMDGRSQSAGQLAAQVGTSRSLASAHLAKLLDGGLISVEQRGRQRHYRLAGSHVAEVIEALLTLAPARRPSTLREVKHGQALRHARMCYDHLAGLLGVALTDALQAQRLIEADDSFYRLTWMGENCVRALGIDPESLRGSRRVFARPCLDWTERRPHLAGALGAGIADRLLQLGWIQRLPNSRALRVTDAGYRGLLDTFALDLPKPHYDLQR